MHQDQASPPDACNSTHDTKRFRRRRCYNWSGKKKPKQYFYAVARGRTPGIYTTWSQAEQQVKGFSRPVHKKFKLRVAAVDFIREHRSREAFANMLREHEVNRQNESATQHNDSVLTAFAVPVTNTHIAHHDVPTATPLNMHVHMNTNLTAVPVDSTIYKL